jgi:hypothetical protein
MGSAWPLRESPSEWWRKLCQLWQSSHEKWFKGMPLGIVCYEYFIKPKCLNGKIRVGVPSQYLWDSFQNLLKVIRRYFTFEGRFDRVYPYHIRLLMHFKGKNPLNLPFFFHRSLKKMEDSVWAEADQLGNNYPIYC